MATTDMQVFTEEELSKIRFKTAELMVQLDKKHPSPKSWIGGNDHVIGTGKDHRSDACLYFDTHGFIKVECFADDDEVKALCNQMESLANQWDPSAGMDSFGTDVKANLTRGDYFLESSSKVHFFAEPTALVDQGTNELKPEYQTDKMSALNKSGHAMHMIPGAFQDYTKSDKIRNLVLDLGWKDPVVPQSMYIFKQKHIGGPVTSHQDSTFLYTTPKQSCLGLWLALQDATLENGCLWVRPASHWESTRRQFKRNSEHFGNEAIKTRSNEAKGDTTAPKLLMEEIESAHKVHWDGGLPPGGYEGLWDAGFVPVECKSGDLLAFSGELDHLSLSNFSDKPRHTFQLHLVEGEKAGVTWSKSNWLQYPHDLPFMRLLDNTDWS